MTPFEFSDQSAKVVGPRKMRELTKVELSALY